MRIKRLQLSNFRPYRDVDINLINDEDRAIIIGSNDVGKTELLNSIYWCVWGELLTKKTEYNKFITSYNTSDQILGIFNSSAFSELAVNEFFKTSVRITYILSKEEIFNRIDDSGELEIERNFYVGKDDDSRLKFFTSKKIEASSINDLDEVNPYRINEWPNTFFLRHPTKDSNSQISEEPENDRESYFPNQEVTKFFMLDTTLLSTYLDNSQSNNKKISIV